MIRRALRRDVAVMLTAGLLALGVAVGVLALHGKPSTPTYVSRNIPVPAITKTVAYGIKWPASPRVLFFGDSWTAGTGASRVTLGWAYQAGAQLGAPYRVDGVGGSGFLAGPTYTQRLREEHPTFQPNVIVIQSDGNGAGAATTPAFRMAVHSTLAAASDAFPGAQIVLVGALNTSGLRDLTLRTFDNALADQAYAEHVPFINTYGWYANRPAMVYASLSAPGHPNDAGHALYAHDFLVALRQIKS